jgi:hypothetical protein
MRVESGELETAILRHLASLPVHARTGEGTVLVKVALHDSSERVDEVRGGLFLSMPYQGADEEWLRKLMAFVRDEFEGTEGLRVVVGNDEELSAFDDAEAGMRLLNLFASITITAR